MVNSMIEDATTNEMDCDRPPMSTHWTDLGNWQVVYMDGPAKLDARI